MCFFTQITHSASQISRHFDAKFKQPDAYHPGIMNGFLHPHTPVITHAAPDEIQHLQWGLIPSWAKDNKIKSMTLNARIETIDEKPSFRNSIHNRCMIIADGFF